MQHKLSRLCKHKCLVSSRIEYIFLQVYRQFTNYRYSSCAATEVPLPKDTGPMSHPSMVGPGFEESFNALTSTWKLLISPCIMPQEFQRPLIGVCRQAYLLLTHGGLPVVDKAECPNAQPPASNLHRTYGGLDTCVLQGTNKYCMRA